jgi:Flp pilus assembly pilin Flp
VLGGWLRKRLIAGQSVFREARGTMRLLRRLWNEDDGGLIAAEYLLMGTLLTIGLIVGIAAVQQAIINRLDFLACLIDPSCTP